MFISITTLALIILTIWGVGWLVVLYFDKISIGTFLALLWGACAVFMALRAQGIL